MTFSFQGEGARRAEEGALFVCDGPAPIGKGMPERAMGTKRFRFTASLNP
jgi:hypothetical protein